MDLPLWEPSDGQGNLTSFSSNYHVGDVRQCGHYSVCGPDMIEEDALNEKSCVQVLRILMDKADEEIVKLEEEIVMLQCQLAWDDEDWSKPCSAALREKIDHLEILIQSLKKEITDDVHYFGVQLEQPEKLAQRLHDLVKPLLENYFLVKSKQTESSVMQMSVLAADGLSKKKLEASPSKHNKKVEEKECFNLLEKNERKSPSMELEERKINHPQQKKDAIISKFIATDELSEKDINKLNRLQGKRMPNSAPVKSGRRSSIKSEPSDPMVKASSASTSLEKAGSREREERKSTISKAKVTQHRLQRESKVTSHLESRETETKIAETVKPADEILDSQLDCEKQITEAFSKIQKARVYRHVINKNILPTKPLVKIKRKRTKFPKITEVVEAQGTEMNDTLGLFNQRTKHTSKAKMRLEQKIQVQQRHDIETLMINQAKSVSSLKPEGQGPQKKCKAAPEIVQNLCLAEEIDMGSLSVETLKGQRKFGVLEQISKNGKKETQQELSGTKIYCASEVAVTSISSPQKKRKSYFSSQTIREKKGLGNLLLKSAEMDYDALKSIAEEATDNCDAEDVPHNSSPGIKDVGRMSLNDLKTIAKNQRLPGYYKLRKKELQKRLGLEPLYLQQKAYEKEGISPTNTI